MKKNPPSTIAVLSLVVGVIALGLSAYSAMGIWDWNKNFSANVSTEIDDYIERERAKATGQQPPAPTEPVEVSVDDDAMLGKSDAPVTIVEFSDYECPFCGRFFAETFPQIKSNYIDTGKANLVFRDFPLSFHPQARPAAIAAECARKQGDDETYFEYHDLLFKNQSKLSETLFGSLATQMGLNASKFAACQKDTAVGAEVDADLAQGQEYGVSGTPGFFINGRPVSGAMPFATFQALIEEELAK